MGELFKIEENLSPGFRHRLRTWSQVRLVWEGGKQDRKGEKSSKVVISGEVPSRVAQADPIEKFSKV